MTAWWIEDLLASVAPGFAAKRAYSRSIYQNFRSYDAAMRGRRTDSWRATKNSASAEILPALTDMRQRARDLVRNNPYAAAAVSKLAGYVIGSGIAPRFVMKNTRKKARLQAEWDDFVNNCDPEGRHDFYGLEALIARTVFESGECLIRWHHLPFSSKRKIPVQMSVLEPDYLDHTKNSYEQSTGEKTVSGVVYDRDGRRIAYWLYDQHPGEMLNYATAAKSSRVSAEFVTHIFQTLRPGQARGVTIFAPAALRLRDINDTNDAAVLKWKLEACFVGFVKQGGGQSTPISNTLKTQADGKPIEELRPGMLHYLGLGEEVTFGQPSSSAGLTDFMVHQLNAVSAGIGIPYYSLTNDVSKANYTSQRAAKVDFNIIIDNWQNHVFVFQLCREAWKRVQMYSQNLDDTLRVEWAIPAREWVDPLKDAQAELLLVRSGMKPLRSAIAERGRDPEAVIAEYAETNQALDDAGVVLDSDPRHIGASGTAQYHAPDKAGQTAANDTTPNN